MTPPINKDPCIGKGADGVPIYTCGDKATRRQKSLDLVLFDARQSAAKERAENAQKAPPDATTVAPPVLPKGLDIKDIPTVEDLGLGDVLKTPTPSSADLVTQPLKKAEPPKVEEPPKEEPKVDTPPASPPPAEAPANPRTFSRTGTFTVPGAAQGATVKREEEAACKDGIQSGACLGALDDGTRTESRTVGGVTITNTYNVKDVGNTSGITLGCDERYFKKGDCSKPIQKPEKKK